MAEISRDAEDLLLAFSSLGLSSDYPRNDIFDQYKIARELRELGRFDNAMQELWDSNFYATLDDNGLHYQEGLTQRGHEMVEVLSDRRRGLDRRVSNEDFAHVDSTSWTGLKRTAITYRNSVTFIRLIDEAIEVLSQIPDNETRAQARAYLLAARNLAEAPQPPSELIWQCISKAADVVGLAAVFYAIFAAVLS